MILYTVPRYSDEIGTLKVEEVKANRYYYHDNRNRLRYGLLSTRWQRSFMDKDAAWKFVLDRKLQGIKTLSHQREQAEKEYLSLKMKYDEEKTK